MGKEVISNVEQLIASAKSQLKMYDNHNKEYIPNVALLKTLYLLKFYAIECGIKALYLKKNYLRDTSQLTKINGLKYGHGHDLELWMKELKITATALKNYKGSNDSYPISKLHERLRYGASIASSELNSQISILKELAKLLKVEKVL